MIRVISGTLKGRKLTVGEDVRPTTDRMRERLFSILDHARYPSFAGARVADLFAGSGALGIEAISRGAVEVCCVDVDPNRSGLSANRRALGLSDRLHLIRGDATNLPASNHAYDFMFMDPPYGKNLISDALQSLMNKGWVGKQSVIIAEMDKKDPLDLPDGLTVVDDRRQGRQRLVILRMSGGDAD